MASSSSSSGNTLVIILVIAVLGFIIIGKKSAHASDAASTTLVPMPVLPARPAGSPTQHNPKKIRDKIKEIRDSRAKLTL